MYFQFCLPVCALIEVGVFNISLYCHNKTWLYKNKKKMKEKKPKTNYPFMPTILKKTNNDKSHPVAFYIISIPPIILCRFSQIFASLYNMFIVLSQSPSPHQQLRLKFPSCHQHNCAATHQHTPRPINSYFLQNWFFFCLTLFTTTPNTPNIYIERIKWWNDTRWTTKPIITHKLPNN